MTDQDAMLSPVTVDAIMARSGVQFGTSGARGEVVAMTDYVCHAYTTGFLQHLADLGEFAPGTRVALAGDLRPSTPRIMAACAQAIRDMGGEVVNCGFVPTPALALYAFGEGIPSIMVTGSHIPDDRNGIKFYRPKGEVLKDDEAGMRGQPIKSRPGAFDGEGMLVEPAPLPELVDVADGYRQRYVHFFGANALSGLHIGVYQHSAVGRDLLVSIVEALGGKATPIGRATKFVPVDTEAIRPEDVEFAKGWAKDYGFDAIISTDGDSDRPLLADHEGEWLRGDVLGVLCARALRAQAVVTPVSSNTVLELSHAFAQTRRTRIGSPYVIAAMNDLLAADAAPVVGYEANGGFLLGSPLGSLAPLPTRDAVLPIMAVIIASRLGTIRDLLGELPPRVTYSDRIQNVPTDKSEAMFARLLEGDRDEQIARLDGIFGKVAGAVTAIDLTDGIRMTTKSGAIIHLRRSGNAPELRCYSESDTAEHAASINKDALAIVRDTLA